MLDYNEHALYIHVSYPYLRQLFSRNLEIHISGTYNLAIFLCLRYHLKAFFMPNPDQNFAVPFMVDICAWMSRLLRIVVSNFLKIHFFICGLFTPCNEHNIISG